MKNVVNMFPKEKEPSILTGRSLWVAGVVNLPIYGELLNFSQITYTGPDKPGHVPVWGLLEEAAAAIPKDSPIVINAIGMEMHNVLPLVLDAAVRERKVAVYYNEVVWDASVPLIFTLTKSALNYVAPDRELLREVDRQLAIDHKHVVFMARSDRLG